jgi:hypothetical protein
MNTIDEYKKLCDLQQMEIASQAKLILQFEKRWKEWRRSYIILAAIVIGLVLFVLLFVSPASAQYRPAVITPWAYQPPQVQYEPRRQYYENQTIIDNRPVRHGGPSVIYNRNGNITTGSDGTICIEMGSTTVCN